MRDFDTKTDARIAQVFEKARGLNVSAPSHLETRVLAHLREKRESRWQLRFWKTFAAGLSLACLLVLGLFFSQQSGGEKFQAFIGKPHVIMVKMQEFQAGAVANAEVVLPEGVYFYSESFPGIREKRELKFAWDDSAKRPYLPFVIHSDEVGSKFVKVRFFDENGQVVAEREFKIEFTRAAS